MSRLVSKIQHFVSSNRMKHKNLKFGKISKRTVCRLFFISSQETRTNDARRKRLIYVSHIRASSMLKFKIFSSNRQHQPNGRFKTAAYQKQLRRDLRNLCQCKSLFCHIIIIRELIFTKFRVSFTC